MNRTARQSGFPAPPPSISAPTAGRRQVDSNAIRRLSVWLSATVWLGATACAVEKPPLGQVPRAPAVSTFAPNAETTGAKVVLAPMPPGTTSPPHQSIPLSAVSNAPELALESPPPVPHSAQTKPVLNAELLRLRYDAQTRILGKDVYFEDAHGLPPPRSNSRSRSDSLPQSSGNGYTLGSFIPVENEPSLAAFHEQLERLATGRDQDGKVRILAYGASHTQGDLFTSYLRYYLQSRFGNGGLGFVPLTKLNDWHRMLDATIEENGFKTEHSQRNTPSHGYLGLLGAAARGSAKAASARIIPKNNTEAYLSATDYELSYAAEQKGGDLLLFVNEVPRIQLKGRALTPEDRFFKFRMAPGWHQVEVRPAGNGTARVYGVTVERPEPGIVVDTLGIGGSRAANMLSWNEQAWTEQVRRRDPALYILAYGTNESTGSRAPIEHYRAELSQVLERFERALPGVSCLLVGPFDYPKETPHGYMTRARLLEVIETQRAVARERGCGFWDGYRFMGGPGSMREWVRADPSLASPDHIHLNARGYVRVGMALADAIMRAYDEFHLVDRASEPPTPPDPGPHTDPTLNAKLSHPR